MEPTIAEALTGGFLTYFSIWQLCIMQVTPFYLAFFLGSYFLLHNDDRRSRLVPMAVIAVGMGAGFSAVFALIASPGITLGSTILRNLPVLKPAAGAFIISAGLLMMVFAFLPSSAVRPRYLAALSPFIGASFAVAYSPCIAPALARILNYAGTPATAVKGLRLLLMYGAGLSTALALTGAVLAILVRVGRGGRSRHTAAAILSFLVFMGLGVLLITGMMLRYKAFLVNLV